MCGAVLSLLLGRWWVANRVTDTGLTTAGLVFMQTIMRASSSQWACSTSLISCICTQAQRQQHVQPPVKLKLAPCDNIMSCSACLMQMLHCFQQHAAPNDPPLSS